MNRIMRIGIFTAVGIFAIVAFSVYVNDHPYWYRRCNEVKIHVDDATGLRRKSPVKTLGLEIGYINAVDLDGDRVMVRVCVTGPVTLNAETRAFIRSSGLLGDKFLELKPVDKVGGTPSTPPSAPAPTMPATPDKTPEEPPKDSSAVSPAQIIFGAMNYMLGWIVPEARAEEKTLSASREAELQDTMKKVAKLVDQLTLMVGDLREVTQQKEFKETIVNLNASMKHLQQLLRPDGKVMKNVDAAMESMKNTMASAETVMNKIKEGEGTIGKFINDPSLYDDIRAAIQGVNLLLGKAGLLRTYVDIGGHKIDAYNGTKGYFRVTIAPNPTRYYLLGITNDPRGRDRKTTTTTSVNGGAPTTVVENKNEEKGLAITAMFGKHFGPLDLSVGLKEDYGTVGVNFWLDSAKRYGILSDIYSKGSDKGKVTARIYARATIYSALYVVGGLDQLQTYTDSQNRARKPWFVGLGVYFDDDDLKYLLAFK
jgi:phospholipid/cholesterol/gamma-HCH transport system substrate-binding protein